MSQQCNEPLFDLHGQPILGEDGEQELCQNLGPDTPGWKCRHHRDERRSLSALADRIQKGKRWVRKIRSGTLNMEQLAAVELRLGLLPMGDE